MQGEFCSIFLPAEDKDLIENAKTFFNHTENKSIKSKV